MIRQFKIILFAVCGCILSQGCNNDQRSDKLTLDKKKQLIEYMRTKYNDMGIIIVLHMKLFTGWIHCYLGSENIMNSKRKRRQSNFLLLRS